MAEVDQIRQLIQGQAHPVTGSDRDYDALLRQIGDARFVLLGEASHGTHEFYRARARITRRLIEEKGFVAVAVEADWPDAYRINEYVRNPDDTVPAVEALGRFKRFPAWMWRNTDVLDFVGWLDEYNVALPAEQRVGFYGLDLYSLHSSIEAVIHYLEAVDPQAAVNARARYGCFDMVESDPQFYGLIAGTDPSLSCEEEVVAQLQELRRRAADYHRRDGRLPEDALFYAEQNARLAVNAEEYYRNLYRGRVSTWNMRDRHMVETLEELARYLSKKHPDPKIVVWAHNSHLGDARATEMGWGGEWNVGQLVRERFGKQAVLVGFSTYTGTVTAADDWDGPARRKHVRPGLRNSYERLFHEIEIPAYYLNIHEDAELARVLDVPRLERAIGVIYRPQSERISHYFKAQLASQFDALIHFDTTRAVEPLEITAEWKALDLEETYPFGI